MKKKLVGLMLSAVLAVSVLAACGSNEGTPETEAPEAAEDADEADETEAADEDADAADAEETDEADAADEDEADADTADDDSLAYIVENGEFILGLDDSFPPMGFRNDDQEIVGFDVDVAREVAERLGVELVLQPISWAAKEQELDSKNIDCIWNGFTVNEERKANLSLSDVYMLNTQVAVVLSDSDVETLADLEGKDVVIQNGSTAEDAVTADEELLNSFNDLIKVDDNVQAMLDLKVGASDVVVMDEVVARYYTELEANQGEYKIIEESLSDEEYAVGFRKSDIALRDEVNSILKDMAEDGTLAQISEEWFGTDITIIK